MQNCVFAVIDELVRASGEVLPREFSEPPLQLKDQRVSQAKMYITDNIRRGFTLSEVSAIVHLSEKQLSRLFLKQEGESIFSFIQSIRLAEAKKLLESSDAPLRDIAEALGWSSEYNFIRFFKTAEGMPPGAYRKSLINR